MTHLKNALYRALIISRYHCILQRWATFLRSYSVAFLARKKWEYSWLDWMQLERQQFYTSWSLERSLRQFQLLVCIHTFLLCCASALFAVIVCLSACPSATRVVPKWLAKHRIMQATPHGSPETIMQNIFLKFWWDHPQWGTKYMCGR